MLDSDAVIDEFGKSNGRLVSSVDLGLLNEILNTPLNTRTASVENV